MCANSNGPPLYEYIINKISDKYDTLIFKGKTKDDKVYVRLDNIYIIDRKFLFVNDTGYGDTYESACNDLVNLFTNPEHRIRYYDLYATTTIRNIIKSCYKKYNKEDGIND